MYDNNAKAKEGLGPLRLPVYARVYRTAARFQHLKPQRIAFSAI